MTTARSLPRSVVAAMGAIVGIVLLPSCKDGGDAVEIAGEPRTLDERIDAVIATGDPRDAFDCVGHSMPVWDVEGAVDAPTAEAAAAEILADDTWRALGLPDAADREALVDRRFSPGVGLFLPVLIDGELGVLLSYDAQGPEIWSIGGGIWCDARG